MSIIFSQFEAIYNCKTVRAIAAEDFPRFPWEPLSGVAKTLHGQTTEEQAEETAPP